MANKVLLISYLYPPCMSIGALRPGKFAKYLPENGWEPVVVTRSWEGEPLDASAGAGVRVVATGDRDRLALFRRLSGSGGSGQFLEQEFTPEPGIRGALRRFFGYWAREVLAYPDAHVGWKPFALCAAEKIIREEKITALMSSSFPFTCHLVAAELKRKTGLPWLADLRDLWSGSYHHRHTALRRCFETRLERKTFAAADCITTVSEPLAAFLRRMHGRDTEVIYNGFDPDDYPEEAPKPDGVFRLVYTGTIYNGRQDIEPVLKAVAALASRGEIEAGKFVLSVCGPSRQRVEALAARRGVAGFVEADGIVSYRESLARQKGAAALLLLTWLPEGEKGVYTGKLFEYLGAGRPVVAVPGDGDAVDSLLRRAKAGVVAATGDELARTLAGWYRELCGTGRVRHAPDDGVVAEFARARQAEKLARLLDAIVGGTV